MNNKLALRFISILIFGLFLIVGIFFLYNTVKCQVTPSSYYCFDEYGITLSLLAVSATILFFISLGLFILAKFYKGGRLWIRYGIPYVLLVLALIAFVPFVFTVFIQEPSYKEWLAKQEQWRVEFEQKKVQECEERRLMIAQHKDGDPMPTWPMIECGKY